MIRLLRSRLASLVPTLLGMATLVFVVLHVVPGDPVDLMLGEGAAPAARAELRTRLGLDRPLVAQYADWMARAAYGDLGTSLRSGRPVAALVAERLPATGALALAAAAVAVLLGVPLGAMAAAARIRGKRRGGAERFAAAASVAALAVPSFWLGPMLVSWFSVRLGWLPVAGGGDALHLVLPALVLGAGMSGILVRMTRASMLEALAEDHIRTAVAKGAGRTRVMLVHALPNAAGPVLSILGLQLGALLAGAVVTETLFAWPGLGRLVLEGIQSRDYPVVQGAVLAMATATVAANLVAEMLQAAIDPRVREQSGAARVQPREREEAA